MDLMYEIFPVILFILAIILLVVLIILAIRMIGTLKKVDNIVTDVNSKMHTIDNAFSMIDTFTDSLSNINDKIVSLIANGIRNFFKRKKNKGESENEEE